MKQGYALFGALALGLICLPILASPQPPVQNAQPAGTSAKHSAPLRRKDVHADNGERIFEQNCSRCHNAPEGFSPRISGTIARHMRMRASLSQKDEQELLRFLNP